MKIFTEIIDFMITRWPAIVCFILFIMTSAWLNDEWRKSDAWAEKHLTPAELQQYYNEQEAEREPHYY